MTTWADGVPYVLWAIESFRERSRVIERVVVPHDPGCVADHGPSRYWFFHRAFLDTDVYLRATREAYQEEAIHLVAQFPGAIEALDELLVDTVDVVCLGCRMSIPLTELDTADATLFDGALHVVGRMTGPIPISSRELDEIESDMSEKVVEFGYDEVISSKPPDWVREVLDDESDV